ncbi:MAG TPA: serpin family protein [Jatrophihabitantaceae bacterium]|nr:serpin family protein [Jatrophihabitantaceae bacterium]
MKVARSVARYAATFHAAVGDGHHVASPLGAWLLLALAAPAATGQLRERLADLLGADIEDARDAAAALLAEPHPAVSSAAATWLRDASTSTGAMRRWLAGLPAQVEVGDMPTQAQVDAWASEHTSGLIDVFPLTVTPRTVLILASALATRVSWEVPFDLAPSVELGVRSAWSQRLTQALRSPQTHDAFIATTQTVGDVAVHTATSTDGLAVTSLIASADAEPAAVLAAAHEIALGSVRTRSLFDLPLGDSPLWTVVEGRSDRGNEERHTAVLPAWSAQSTHELTAPEFGLAAAADVLIGLLPPDDYQFEARQSAVARYSRTGFEAAAVTAIGIRATAMLEPRGVRRTAILRFGHPYAVVAVAQGGGPWHGVPVFSAWVTDPEEPA